MPPTPPIAPLPSHSAGHTCQIASDTKLQILPGCPSLQPLPLNPSHPILHSPNGIAQLMTDLLPGFALAAHIDYLQRNLIRDLGGGWTVTNLNANSQHPASYCSLADAELVADSAQAYPGFVQVS